MKCRHSQGGVGIRIIMRTKENKEAENSFFVAEALPGETASFTPPETVSDGGSGFTHILRASRHGRVFILKALKPEYAGSLFHQALLRKEFEVAAGMSHPGIATVFSFEMVEGFGPCIVEEWIAGMPLDEYVASAHPSRRQLLDILLKLADAVAYIHSRQTVHRDLKPSNVIMPASGDTPKIIDFGVADTPALTMAKGHGGTHGFAAPEQYSADAVIDHRADIFAFGRILSALGVFPATASACTRHDPLQRPQSMAEVRRRLVSEAGRRRRIAVAASVAVILVASVAIGVSVVSRPPRGAAPVVDNVVPVDMQAVAVPDSAASVEPPSAESSAPAARQASEIVVATEADTTEKPGQVADSPLPQSSELALGATYVDRLTAAAFAAAASRFADHIASADTASAGIGYRRYHICYWRHLAKEDMRRWVEENPEPGHDADEAATLSRSLIDRYSDAHKKEHLAGLKRIEDRLGPEYVVIDNYVADEKEDGTLVIYYLGEDDVWHWKEVPPSR